MAKTVDRWFADKIDGPVRTRFVWLNDRVLTHLFVWPSMGLLLFVTVFPLIWSLYLSFTSYSVIRDPDWTRARWVGLENYASLLGSVDLWTRFQVSAAFVVPAVALEFVLGFGIALLLNREFRGRSLVSTLILLPMMLPPVVVGLFWRFLLQGDIGIVNYFLRDVLGLAEVPWLTDRRAALASLVLVDVWQWTPFVTLIAMAGLSAVPRYLYEAAEVDRASAWFRFRHITLPLVLPLLIIAILFRLMDAYRLFELAWVLTGGGPGEATKVLPIHLYKVAFGDFRTGVASAMGYLMLVVIVALANLLIRSIRRLRGEGYAP